MKKLINFLVLFLTFTSVFAQGSPGIQMDDALRSNGKIYVVVTIIAIIFIGLAIYLFAIDRRLKKMEKNK